MVSESQDIGETARRIRAEYGDGAFSIVSQRVEETRAAADRNAEEFWLSVAFKMALPEEGHGLGSHWWFMQRIEYCRHRAMRADAQAARESDRVRDDLVEVAAQWRELALQAELIARTSPSLSAPSADFDLPTSVLIGSLPVGFAIVGRRGKLLIANDEIRRFLPSGSVPLRENMRNCRWTVHAADGRAIQPEQFPSARALRGEIAVLGLRMTYLQDDGREAAIYVASLPIRQDGRDVSGALTVLIDMTSAA